MYLHYIHINKNWYYWFSEWNYTKIFNSKKFKEFADFIWFAGEDTTKSNAKKILKTKFPNDNAILTYFYHANPSIGCFCKWAKENNIF